MGIKQICCVFHLTFSSCQCQMPFRLLRAPWMPWTLWKPSIFIHINTTSMTMASAHGGFIQHFVPFAVLTEEVLRHFQSPVPVRQTVQHRAGQRTQAAYSHGHVLSYLFIGSILGDQPGGRAQIVPRNTRQYGDPNQVFSTIIFMSVSSRRAGRDRSDT